MKKNKNLYVIVGTAIICVLILVSFVIYAISINTKPKTIENKVVNEITNKVVNYEELTITDVDQALVEAIKKVENQVIGVTVKAVVDSEYGEVEMNVGYASGIIYKREEVFVGGHLNGYLYYCITNAHVVNEQSYKIPYTVHQMNYYAYLGYQDLEIKTTLLGYDVKSDIAVITFEYYGLIEPIKVANSQEVQKGQLVFAVGNPYSYDYYGSSTFGMVSSPLRYVSTDTDGDGIDDFYSEYIQHDVAINSGNSGGGLFNLRGELIGINSMKIIAENFENMSFSIPTHTAFKIINNYIEQNKPIVRARLSVLGYEIRSLSEANIKANEEIEEIPDIYNEQKPYGIYISKVEEGTISHSQIQAHDIILAVNDIEITRTYILTAKLNSLAEGFMVGDTLNIKYYDHVLKTIKYETVVLEP